MSWKKEKKQNKKKQQWYCEDTKLPDLFMYEPNDEFFECIDNRNSELKLVVKVTNLDRAIDILRFDTMQTFYTNYNMQHPNIVCPIFMEQNIAKHKGYIIHCKQEIESFYPFNLYIRKCIENEQPLTEKQMAYFTYQVWFVLFFCTFCLFLVS